MPIYRLLIKKVGDIKYSLEINVVHKRIKYSTIEKKKYKEM